MTSATIVDDKLLAHEPNVAAISEAPDGDEPGKGVVLVTCADPTILAITLAAIAHGIHTSGTIAGLSLCPVSAITFVYAAGSRDGESIKSYASKDIQSVKLLAQPIEHCRRFDPLCPGGVPYMMRHLTPGTCVFAVVDYRDLKRDDAIAALIDLNAAAVELGALVVIFVTHTKKQDVTWLRDYCAVAVEVRKCEPGPGAPVALALDNLTLAADHVLGVGRVIVEAFLDLDGGWTYRPEPFIAERAVIRLAWYLAWEGVTIEKIAAVIGIHKSNVSRGLDALLIPPKNAVGLAPPDGWRDRWANCYDLSTAKRDAKQEPAETPSNPPTVNVGREKDMTAGSPRSTGGGSAPVKFVAPSTTRENRKM